MVPDSISVIVEWENTLLAERKRGQQMLEVVVEQLSQLSNQIKSELLILYNGSKINRQDLESLIEEQSRIGVDFIDSGDLHYYEIKNLGARKATGEILIFVDSDVIPQQGWLGNLLDSFQEGEVDVVCGPTFLEHHDLYSRSFALFWFFPLNKSSRGLRPAERFFANNVAFKRQIFLDNPFPFLPQMRGQCRLLSQQLRDKGVGIYVQLGASVSHPPPNGFNHFVKRGIAYGYDGYLKAKRTGNFIWYSPIGTISRSLGYSWLGLFKILKNHRQVGLNLVTMIAAILIAFGFYGLVFIGELMTMVSPSFVRKNFRI